MRARFAVLPILILLSPAAAHAEAVPVTCTDLQAALDAAQVNDVITLSNAELCVDSYTLPAVAITLRGQDGAGFQSGGGGRSLTTDDPVVGTQTIDNLIFKGADAILPPRLGASRRQGGVGGGMSWEGDGLTVSNSTFTDIATPYESGGGLFVDNLDADGLPIGSVSLANDTFTGNSTTINGGGARVVAGKITVTDSVFRGNEAGDNGGGLALTMGDQRDRTRSRGTPPANPDASVTGSTFDGNGAGTDGDTSFVTSVGGGGLYAADPATRTFDSPSIAREARPSRRAADPAAGQLALGDNVYTDNHVQSASAVETDDTDRFGGGAQFVGIGVHAFTTETYRGNEVLGTEGSAEGGGFSINGSGQSDADYTGENTVVVGNTAGNGDSAGLGELPAGGGVYLGCVDCQTALTLVHATVTGNSLTVGGDPVMGDDPVGSGIQGNDNGDTVTLDRSIVFGNTVDFDADDSQVAEATTTVTNSDDEDLCDTAQLRAADANGNICVAPEFDAAIGSPLQAKGSPTIDQVDPGAVTDDFQHEKRPSPQGGKVDMGADEYQFPAAPTATATATSSPSATVTPAPTATVRPSPTPDNSDVEDDNDKGKRKRCGSRRSFTIKLRRLPGVTFVSAKFHVNGKRVRTRRFKSGRLGTRIDLRGIRRGTISIRIAATTSTGAVLKGKRVYHPCYRGKKPHMIPKL